MSQVVWYSHLFKNFSQLVVIHTVKGLGAVNKAGVDVFLELSCFFYDPTDSLLYFFRFHIQVILYHICLSLLDLFYSGVMPVFEVLHLPVLFSCFGSTHIWSESSCCLFHMVFKDN